MTIKDIEAMANELNSDVVFYVEVIANVGTTSIYFKSFNNMVNHIKKNYNDDLTHKENAERKIERVGNWRRN